MRILLLTQLFEPELHGRGLILAKALVDYGYDVEVLTGFPNYPGGKLYGGYKLRPWMTEYIDGIRVNRVALYPSHDRSGFRRTLTYLSFAASSLIFGLFLIRRPTVVIGYNLITLGPTIRLFRLVYGSKSILDVQDIWPESVTNSGMLRLPVLNRLLAIWTNWEYRSQNLLIVSSPAFKQILVSRGINSEQIETVYNWDASELVETSDRCNIELPKDKFNVVYAGNIGTAQSLDILVKCAALAIVSTPEVHFTVVGEGIDKKRLIESSKNLPNLDFRDPIEGAQISALYKQANALLVHLKNLPIYCNNIPSKTQSYLRSGIPILCGVGGETGNLTEEAKAGLCFTPEDPQSLLEAIQKLLLIPEHAISDMKRSGKLYYETNMSSAVGTSRFAAILKSLISTVVLP